MSSPTSYVSKPLSLATCKYKCLMQKHHQVLIPQIMSSNNVLMCHYCQIWWSISCYQWWRSCHTYLVTKLITLPFLILDEHKINVPIHEQLKIVRLNLFQSFFMMHNWVLVTPHTTSFYLYSNWDFHIISSINLWAPTEIINTCTIWYLMIPLCLLCFTLNAIIEISYSKLKYVVIDGVVIYCLFSNHLCIHKASWPFIILV